MNQTSLLVVITAMTANTMNSATFVQAESILKHHVKHLLNLRHSHNDRTVSPMAQQWNSSRLRACSSNNMEHMIAHVSNEWRGWIWCHSLSLGWLAATADKIMSHHRSKLGCSKTLSICRKLWAITRRKRNESPHPAPSYTRVVS